MHNRYWYKGKMNKKEGWAVWFVGLPGCGKSSISKEIYKYLTEKGLEVVYLQLDEWRKKYFPEAGYTEEDRKKVYEKFGDYGIELVNKGKGVIFDATAYKVWMRRRVREKIKKFAEIYIQCSIETAMKRESSRPKGLVMAEIYAKALERKRTGKEFPGLGEVIGIDVPFEEDPEAELVVENDTLSLDEAVKLVKDFINNWLNLR